MGIQWMMVRWWVLVQHKKAAPDACSKQNASATPNSFAQESFCSTDILWSTFLFVSNARILGAQILFFLFFYFFVCVVHKSLDHKQFVVAQIFAEYIICN